MKASYRWLRALAPELDLSPAEVAQRFTSGGLEVESITPFGAASIDVALAEVVSKEPHPSRGKLQLVTVRRGDGGTQRVVCGASNVPEPGAFVVLAPLGTHLPAVGMTLEPREIGGVVSEGMLCSEAELGLRSAGGDAGILVFQGEPYRAGQTLAEAIPESHDVIFELGLTPNRPDALGHVGLARELCALTGRRFAPTAGELRSTLKKTTEEMISVAIEDEERCPQYGAVYVEGLKVGPSPLGLVYRLESLGIRSISNVVDVTNLILMKWGHPIHAFDRSFLRGGKIVVRRARDGEELVTLDSVKRKLVGDDLVIADAEGAVALAGVMGGEGSEVRPETEGVLIECAYFSPRGVRRTARRYGMHSEASHRFERGVDPGDIAAVLYDTAALLTTLAGGSAASTMPIFGARPAPRTPIELRRSRTATLLGLEIAMDEAKRSLENLGCEIQSADDEMLVAIAPTHRPDLTMEADLIEEVLRLHGIDNVKTELPPIVPIRHVDQDAIAARLKRAAIELGLSEALTFSFVSRRELEVLGAPEPNFVLKNPLSEERNAMRTSLLPGLLEALGRSRRHGVSDVRLFATGARFLSPSAEARLPTEARSFAAVVAGERETVLEKPQSLDIWDVKGVALELVDRALARTSRCALQATSDAHLHPKGAADIWVGDRKVGTFGPLHPRVLRKLDLGGPAFVIELDVDALSEIGIGTPVFRPIPVLPAATRDASFVVHEDVDAGVVGSAIAEAGGDLCESVALFDLYRGASLPADHRSLAFHIVYRDPKAATDPERARTLTDAEVEATHAKVVENVKARFGAALRQ